MPLSSNTLNKDGLTVKTKYSILGVAPARNLRGILEIYTFLETTEHGV